MLLGMDQYGIEMLEVLRDSVPDLQVNARDALGLTPLAWAAMMSDTDAIRILVRSGADANIADIRGMTPLMRTADAACMAELLRGGADTESLDSLHQTALMFAISSGPATRCLLGWGASVDAVQLDGTPASHACVYYGFTDALGVIMDHGFDWRLRDNRGLDFVLVAFGSGDAMTLETIAAHLFSQEVDYDLDAENSDGVSARSAAEDRKSRSPEVAHIIDRIIGSLDEQNNSREVREGESSGVI